MMMQQQQWDGIVAQLATLKQRSPFYREKFKDVDIAGIKTQQDFERLPFSCLLYTSTRAAPEHVLYRGWPGASGGCRYPAPRPPE